VSARHELNAPGPWYVDKRCIDCSAARTVAPGLIVRRGGQSVFARQPETEDELVMAWRARLLCPTASVRSEAEVGLPGPVFPEEMTSGIFRLGFNARASYGAHSFLIRGMAGNAMVDSPRWTRAAVESIERLGGLAHILLSHRDDVADAQRFARRFGARVWIHADDSDAAPFATDILRGKVATPVDADWLAIPVPGHTKGSVVYLFEGRRLFTGDSLAWSFERDDLIAFRDACWFSWSEQTRSLRRLLDYPFDWVFAGHGGSRHLPPEEMHRRLRALIARMEER
jgi:glyoxylase-like metal-dependent hydrolase (beta-lactamase superfamily II)